MRQDRWKRIKKRNKRMMNEFHRISGAKRGLNRGERRKVGVLVISRYRNLYAILIHRERLLKATSQHVSSNHQF